MRDAGVSSAGMESDMGGMEDELPDDGAAVDGGTDTAPETATGTEVGGSTGTEQTI
jgi:hypothetical protein